MEILKKELFTDYYFSEFMTSLILKCIKRNLEIKGTKKELAERLASDDVRRIVFDN